MNQKQINALEIKFDNKVFIGTTMHTELTHLIYVVTVESIRNNMRLFMERRFSVEAVEKGDCDGHELAEAPTNLTNYLDVELAVRGIHRETPEELRHHLLESLMSDWGFTWNSFQRRFTRPGVTWRAA